ncbi:hypothetical protein E2C01_065622 [Portunus trituberculatus]|uniref:Uncharacterized protein n=1 Tax=Portunus trituberculatus TaxID=210409 RepID=A0A5B7HNW4_PORTR|nr:hypothetical protein [Portunus trituberculatus]
MIRTRAHGDPSDPKARMIPQKLHQYSDGMRLQTSHPPVSQSLHPLTTHAEPSPSTSTRDTKHQHTAPPHQQPQALLPDSRAHNSPKLLPHSSPLTDSYCYWILESIIYPSQPPVSKGIDVAPRENSYPGRVKRRFGGDEYAISSPRT